MKNLSVVVADDEQLVLRDLKELVDWNKLGFTIVGMATSGEQALKYIRKNHPHLLITDIRMLGMNGLDLIEIAHHEFPDMKFLIITSCDEFDYAKRAIANGVMDYLLKTEITNATLTQKLISIANSFQNIEAIHSAIYEQELSGYLVSSEEISIANGQFPNLVTLQNCKYYFNIITTCHMISRNYGESNKSIPVNLNILKENVLNFAKEYCVKPIVCQNNDFVFLGVAATTNRQFLTFFRDLQKRMMYKLGHSFMGYVHFYLQKRMTIKEFRNYYQPLKPLIQYHTIFYPDKPLNLELLKSLHYINTSRFFPFQSLVFDENHHEQNILLIKDYIMECCANYDIFSLCSFYSRFCTHLEIKSNNQLQLPVCLHAPTPEHFQKWLYNTMLECIQLLTRGEEYRYSSSVDTAIRFMKQNYSNYQLSSTVIADHVGLSANRLGVLIKQETGKTVNEYLNGIRVEKAIYLLENTSMKIYEISEKCGYKTSQYFSQIIYQKTGKHPIDFRKVIKPCN